MKRIILENNKEQGIISLAVILTVGFFAFTLAASVAAGVLSEVNKNQNSAYGDMSFYSADGASKNAMKRFLAEYEANPTCFKTSSCPLPSYIPESALQVNNSLISSLQIMGTWPNYVAIANSQNSKSTRISRTRFTVFPEGLAFNFAVFSNGDLELSGNAQVEGNVFSNGDIDFVGNSSGVNGDASSVGCIENCSDSVGSVEGISNSNVQEIEPPVIDPQPYIDLAIAPTGETFINSSVARAFLRNQSRSGIFYVSDNEELDLSGNNTVINGSLIKEGDLRLSGGSYGSPNHDLVAIIVHGDLVIAGGAEIHGIVYVTGSTTFGAGGGTIVGSLISAGGVTSLTGNTNIIFDADLIPSLLEMVGLQTETTSEPRVLNWEEI